MPRKPPPPPLEEVLVDEHAYLFHFAGSLSADWWTAAACRTAEPDIYFPVTGARGRQASKARAICARCGVQQECLAVALEDRSLSGIWGGLDDNERELVRRRSRGSLERVRSAGEAG